MSRVPCPECGTKIEATARGCACGWGSHRGSYPPAGYDDEARQQRGRMIADIESVKTDEARKWLESHGIHKAGMSRKEKTEANLAYMRRMKVMPKPEPTAWAYEILSRIADGVKVSGHAEAMAREVTKIKREHLEAA